jgi:hypothetical protein
MDFTVNFGAINLLVVFAATVAANLLGGLWYSPALFGKWWSAANNLETANNRMRNIPAVFIAAFILQLIAASMLAALLGPNAGATEGIQLGSLIAVSFVMTAMGMTNLFERRPSVLMWINTTYHIASFSLMGFIIGSWG